MMFVRPLGILQIQKVYLFKVIIYGSLIKNVLFSGCKLMKRIMNMKKIISIGFLSGVIVFCGCSKEKVENPITPGVSISSEIKYATSFAKEMLSTFYLWTSEIASGIERLNVDTCTSPIAVVRKIRYNNGVTTSGVDVDKWTELTNDISSWKNSTQGVETTFGYDLTPYRFRDSNDKVFFVVNFVFKNSPAEKAGIKRGDIILTLNGNSITTSNYVTAYYSSSIKVGMGTLNQETNTISSNGITHDLIAVRMYEDPILASASFDCGGKKVGYLAYSSFDLKSAQALIDICKKFKNESVEELILDLRYNGGGYVSTEELLGSLLAPESDVTGRHVFHTEVYNAQMTEYYKSKDKDLNTYFNTTHKVTSDGENYTEVSIADAILSPKKVYAIITGGTASASEGLLVGLSPYVAVDKIGQNSHGKYCTGWLISTEEVAENVPSENKNWGIYVMVSTFADKDGNNASRPNGFVPDYNIGDDPFDGCQLGDENETMLRAALVRAGKTDFTIPVSTRAIDRLLVGKSLETPKRKTFGLRIGFMWDKLSMNE